MFEFSISGNRWFDGLAQPVLLVCGKTIRYCNPAARRLLPRLKEGDALPPWLPEEGSAATERQLEGLRWVISAVAAEAGTIYLFQCEETGGALNRARVGQLSGQLRVLLGRIDLSAEALEEALVETEQLRNRQWIARLNRSRRQLLRMVSNLDLYSQDAESLLLLYPPAPLELGGLCQELAQETEALAELLGRRLVCCLPEGLTLVRANRELLRRLLLNLLTNAFQAEGDVSLRLERQRDTVRLTMADAGRGIAPERLPLVFSPEERQEELPAPGDGCGLGVPICRKIALLYGGQLLLATDQGETRVSLSLPRCGEESDFRLNAASPLVGTEDADQVLTELSPVLPPECFRMEAL